MFPWLSFSLKVKIVWRAPGVYYSTGRWANTAWKQDNENQAQLRKPFSIVLYLVKFIVNSQFTFWHELFATHIAREVGFLLPGVGVWKQDKEKESLLCFPSAAFPPLLFLSTFRCCPAVGAVVTPGHPWWNLDRPNMRLGQQQQLKQQQQQQLPVSKERNWPRPASSSSRTAVTMRPKETKARRAFSVALSLSLCFPAVGFFGGMRCVRFCPHWHGIVETFKHRQIFTTKMLPQICVNQELVICMFASKKSFGMWHILCLHPPPRTHPPPAYKKGD